MKAKSTKTNITIILLFTSMLSFLMLIIIILSFQSNSNTTYQLISTVIDEDSVNIDASFNKTSENVEINKPNYINFTNSGIFYDLIKFENSIHKSDIKS